MNNYNIISSKQQLITYNDESCIKKWPVNHTASPICNSNSTIENLKIVPKDICSRLINNGIKFTITNAIEQNKFNDLIAIIEGLSFGEIKLFLQESLWELIEKADNAKLDSILQILLSSDSLSIDKYNNIFDLFKNLLGLSLESNTNIETIKLLFSYDLYSDSDEITTIVNKYLNTRELDAIVDIIEKYGAYFNLDKNIIKQVIKEDIDKNNLKNIDKVFNIITAFKTQEDDHSEIANFIVDLLDFAERKTKS